MRNKKKHTPAEDAKSAFRACISLFSGPAHTAWAVYRAAKKDDPHPQAALYRCMFDSVNIRFRSAALRLRRHIAQRKAQRIA